MAKRKRKGTSRKERTRRLMQTVEQAKRGEADKFVADAQRRRDDIEADRRLGIVVKIPRGRP